jgi:beta-phosphoglucomutase-like phosphatase (HAD superfamily)
MKAASAQERVVHVFEDALTGVKAGRAGWFALVVGVDSGPDDAGPAQGEAQRACGANIVVGHLSELDTAALDAVRLGSRR